jgi:membrane-associated protein
VLAAVSLSPTHLLSTFGLIGVFVVVFAESGLLVGFFLPGDSFLFTAGLLSSQGRFSLPIAALLPVCFIAAALGDQVGYAFGSRVGPPLFTRARSRFFNPGNVERTQRYFDEHGPKTVLLARFVPVVRTFAPIMAGVGGMRYRVFAAYNVVGALVWAVGVTLLGYTLGSSVPNIDHYLLPAVALIVIASLVPVAVEVMRVRRRTPLLEDAAAPVLNAESGTHQEPRDNANIGR